MDADPVFTPLPQNHNSIKTVDVRITMDGIPKQAVMTKVSRAVAGDPSADPSLDD